MSEALDNVIDSIPLGFFHYRLLLMCGLAFMADAMEVSLLSFLSTCAGNEWGLSDLQRASITGVVFSGELLGGLFWGPVADLYGRKKAFLLASLLIVTCGFASGAAPNYEWLLVFRAFVGFGVGGLTVPFDLLAEFLPVADRGRFLLYIEYFWTFGSLFVAGVAWGGLDLIGWRGLSYITAIPVTFSSIAAFIYLPESPRWLLVKGRYTEAEEVIKAAAAVSGVTLSPFTLNTSMRPDDDINFEPKILDENITYVDLVRTPQIRRISIPLWIIWAAFGFTYYGIILFVSRLYTTPADADDGDLNISICSFDYQSIFINACAELLGVFIAALIIDPWGRTKTQGFFYGIGGVSVILMGFKLPSRMLLPYVSMIARLGAMGASCATWVATTELYPTEMRATGHSVSSSIAKLGSFLVPYFVVSSISFSTVGVVLGCVNLIASFVALFTLPETKGMKLDVATDAPTTAGFSRICPTDGVEDLVTPPTRTEWIQNVLHRPQKGREKDELKEASVYDEYD